MHGKEFQRSLYGGGGGEGIHNVLIARSQHKNAAYAKNEEDIEFVWNWISQKSSFLHGLQESLRLAVTLKINNSKPLALTIINQSKSLFITKKKKKF